MSVKNNYKWQIKNTHTHSRAANYPCTMSQNVKKFKFQEIAKGAIVKSNKTTPPWSDQSVLILIYNK